VLLHRRRAPRTSTTPAYLSFFFRLCPEINKSQSIQFPSSTLLQFPEGRKHVHVRIRGGILFGMVWLLSSLFSFSLFVACFLFSATLPLFLLSFHNFLTCTLSAYTLTFNTTSPGSALESLLRSIPSWRENRICLVVVVIIEGGKTEKQKAAKWGIQ
jgi:hypothetical protein